MTRKKKLFIYLLIIALFSLGYYYTQAYFISMEECIHDTLRSFYLEDNEYIMSFKDRNQAIALTSDNQDKYFTVIYMDYTGPFYQTTAMEQIVINHNDNISEYKMFTQENGMVIFTYRQNKDIAYLEYHFENGARIICDQWYGDYCGISYKCGKELRVEIRMYDKYDNLIDIKHKAIWDI